jgi:hypothetical protein
MNKKMTYISPAIGAPLCLASMLFMGTATAADPIIGYNDPASNKITVNIEGCDRGSDDGTYNPTGQPPKPKSYLCKMGNTWPVGGQTDAYTPGNLGKMWEELDLVPHIFSTKNTGAASETFQIIVGADNLVNPNTTPPAIGYDQIALITFNPTVSAGSAAQCQLTPVGDNQIGAFGIGGSHKQVVQVVEITQPPNTTCVWNYVEQLAVGASQVSGSSNRSFVVAGSGAQSVPLPSDIQPQTMSKVLSAVENSQYQWTIEKKADPVAFDFGNTCKADTPLTKNVEVKIDFTKGAAYPTDLTATAKIQANNPSQRVVRYALTDVLKSNGDPIDTQNKDEDVTGMENITIEHTALPAGKRSLNDTATAKLQVESLLEPGKWIDVGSLSASYALPDGQIAQGNVVNNSVFIEEVEHLANTIGTGLSFSTMAPVGATGTFGLDESLDPDAPYIPGTATVGPIHWTSNPQTGTGSIVFTKSVSVAQRGYEYEGTLKDTATLPVGAGVTTSASASTALSTNPLADLKVTKTIPQGTADSLDMGEKIVVSFEVKGPSFLDPYKFDLTFNPGDAAEEKMIEGIKQGTYSVEETQALFYPAGGGAPVPANLVALGGNPKSADIAAPKCSEMVAFENIAAQTLPAKAKVIKLTDPKDGLTADETTWDFALQCKDPDTQEVVYEDSLTVTANDVNGAEFETLIEKDVNCVITETVKPDWKLVSVNSDTSLMSYAFSVDLPEDQDKTFAGTFKNVKQGKANVVKTVSGLPPAPGQSFTFQIREGATAYVAGETKEELVTDPNGNIAFKTLLVPGNTYQMCELVKAGWNTSLGDYGTLFVPNSQDPNAPNLPTNVDNLAVCVNFTVAAGETKSFAVDNTYPGGRALTIGYWKNWSSCTKGKQAAVLDDTLKSFSGGGVTIGKLMVDTCAEAVALLDKRDLNGNKRASDPGFNAAAQLLAYRLNIQSGSNPGCAEANNAAMMAQNILGGYFDGYKLLDKKSSGYKTMATALNEAANKLDMYNNNMLCGMVGE